jgi:hypothetical protein
MTARRLAVFILASFYFYVHATLEEEEKAV